MLYGVVVVVVGVVVDVAVGCDACCLLFVAIGVDCYCCCMCCLLSVIRWCCCC